jgi:glutamate formiminotransferase/formiminotetrahydrofolate cyclodeaminase
VSSNLLDLRLRDLLEELASETPTPGGGSLCALATAMAAGLVGMAARASGPGWAEAAGAAAQADALRRRAGPLAERAAQAYESALATLRAPPQLEQEGRDAALGEALAYASDVPLAIAEAAVDVAALGAVVASEGTQERAGDAVAATLLAEAAARAAANLVEINLAAREDDPRSLRARELVQDARAASRRAVPTT